MGFLMISEIIPKNLKLNRKKRIGTVIIVVEGASFEFELLVQIFYYVLHYKCVTKSRKYNKIHEYSEYASVDTNSSRIIIINTANSNIGSIDNPDYFNELYLMLLQKYNLDIKNCSIYYVWDRDNLSNKSAEVKRLLEQFANAYDNLNYDLHGLLLLSYPAIESFLISGFEKDYIDKKIINFKKYVKDNNYKIKDINKDTLKKSVINMHQLLLDMGISEYDTSNFKNINLDIFDYEEKIFKKRQYYKTLSLLMIILIDLKIVEEK